nr:LOW QUALITY PROTEIN: DNA-binding protein RFX8 [Kogia breviceps]
MAEGVAASASGGAGGRGLHGGVIQWLVDNFCVCEGYGVPLFLMREIYVETCGQSAQNQVNPATFGKLVHLVFPDLGTWRPGTRGSARYHYDGICIKKSSFFGARYCCLLGEKRCHSVTVNLGNNARSNQRRTLKGGKKKVSRPGTPGLHTAQRRGDTGNLMSPGGCPAALRPQNPGLRVHSWLAVLTKQKGSGFIFQTRHPRRPCYLQELNPPGARALSSPVQPPSQEGIPQEAGEAYSLALKGTISLNATTDKLYKVGGSSFEVLACILPRNWYQMLGLDPQSSLSAVSVDLRPSEESVVGRMDRLSSLISLLGTSTDLSVLLDCLSSNLQTFVFQPSRSKAEFIRWAASFQLRWNFLLTAVSKAMTLWHRDSFGSWHLFRLLLLEYVIHILQSCIEEEDEEDGDLGNLKEMLPDDQPLVPPDQELPCPPDPSPAQERRSPSADPPLVALRHEGQSHGATEGGGVVARVPGFLVDIATGNGAHMPEPQLP